MATSRLSIYNGALVYHLGETKLETLSDDVPARYALDQVWDGEPSGIVRCSRSGVTSVPSRARSGAGCPARAIRSVRRLVSITAQMPVAHTA